jgi:hypothetical protein
VQTPVGPRDRRLPANPSRDDLERLSRAFTAWGTKQDARLGSDA